MRDEAKLVTEGWLMVYKGKIFSHHGRCAWDRKSSLTASFKNSTIWVNILKEQISDALDISSYAYEKIRNDIFEQLLQNGTIIYYKVKIYEDGSLAIL